MYTYLDIKIVYNIIHSFHFFLNCIKYKPINKLTPFSNVINVGESTKVFYNNTFQDFIFINIDTNIANKDQFCYWMKKKDNEYVLDLERTKFLDTILFEHSDVTEIIIPKFNILDLKVSEDGDVLFLKGYCVNDEGKKSLVINIIDFDNSLEKPLVNCINSSHFTFMIGDTWLYHKYNNRKIVLLSDVIHTSDEDNINNGRVYFTLLGEVNNRIPCIDSNNVKTKSDNKNNLLFGHTLTLSKDKQEVIIGVNDIMILSIHKKLDDLITYYDNINYNNINKE